MAADYETWKAKGRPGGSFEAWAASQGGGTAAQMPSKTGGVTGGRGTPSPAPTTSGLGDLSGFRTYADWQAANRAAGGSGVSAQIQAQYGGQGGQPGDPMAQTGGQHISGGGTTPYTGPADTTKWRTDVPMADSTHPDSLQPSGDPFVDMIRAQGKGSEDYARFSNAQILAWKDKYDPAATAQAGIPKFKNDFGDIVDKPTESGALSKGAGFATGERSAGSGGGGGGRGGGGGGGGGAAGGGGGTAGGVPQFKYTPFSAPSYESAMADPGYQFALKEGQRALEGGAAAKGTLRTSGTLKDLIGYGQDMAATQYGNVYDRALSTWGAQYQGEKDAFAPQYGGWQTQYAGDLSKWTTGQNNDLSRWQTQYGGNLQKYLQKETNIYGLLNQPAPAYPSYG